MGKLNLPSHNIVSDIEDQGFSWLNITPDHTQAILELKNLHKDPFDCLLIAQASYENMRIVTYDELFVQYLSNTLLVKR